MSTSRNDAQQKLVEDIASSASNCLSDEYCRLWNRGVIKDGYCECKM